MQGDMLEHVPDGHRGVTGGQAATAAPVSRRQQGSGSLRPSADEKHASEQQQ